MLEPLVNQQDGAVVVAVPDAAAHGLVERTERLPENSGAVSALARGWCETRRRGIAAARPRALGKAVAVGVVPTCCVYHWSPVSSPREGPWPPPALLYAFFCCTLVSITEGNGMPTISTARALSSAKSSPSDTCAHTR